VGLLEAVRRCWASLWTARAIGYHAVHGIAPSDVSLAMVVQELVAAEAAGVVTDVGGPLSHRSIVAREYHIPAVLGTGVATERLRSGQRIVVDGDAGTVAPRP
jgi:pyruvate,water dikinase